MRHGLFLATALSTALLCAATPIAAQTTAADLKKLNDQLQSLQDSIRRLEAQQAEQKANQQAEITAIKAAQPPSTSTVPKGFIPIPGTDSAIRLGGALVLEGNYDFGPKGGAGMSAPGVPLSGSAASRREGFAQGTAKYSRIDFATLTNMKDDDPIRTFVSIDFNGGTSGNPSGPGGFFTTNQYIPRLREAYISYGNWLVGQTYPLFTDVDSFVDPLDYGLWSSGVPLNRQPEIRYTWPINDKLKVAASLVAPASAYTVWNGTVGAGGSSASDYTDGWASTNASLSQIPDLNIALRYDDSWGHLMFHAMGRQINTDDGLALSSSVSGYGLALTGHINVPTGVTDKWGATDKFGFGLTYGKGIGHYLTELPYQGAYLGRDNRLHAVTAYGLFAGYQHIWSPSLRSSVRYGLTHSDDAPDLNAANAAAWNALLQTAAFNTTYLITPRLKVGLEYEWLSREVQSGTKGDASRLTATAVMLF